MQFLTSPSLAPRRQKCDCSRRRRGRGLATRIVQSHSMVLPQFAQYRHGANPMPQFGALSRPVNNLEPSMPRPANEDGQDVVTHTSTTSASGNSARPPRPRLVPVGTWTLGLYVLKGQWEQGCGMDSTLRTAQRFAKPPSNDIQTGTMSARV